MKLFSFFILLIASPFILLAQEKKLNGKYVELSEPDKVKYIFKRNNYFEYFIDTKDLKNIYGKGKYEIKDDTIIFYFDTILNKSNVDYSYKNINDTINTYHIQIIMVKDKMPFIGASVNFYSENHTLLHEDFTKNNGILNLKTNKNVSYIVVGYNSELNLKLDVKKNYNYHSFSIAWEQNKKTYISGETMKFKIQDIKSRSFMLERDGMYFKYKKRMF